jgi:hypothetical protein
VTRARTILVALVVVLPLLGCSQLPTDGPIVDARSTPNVDQVQPLGIDPLPPEPNASEVDIVSGFLDAMRAWPQRLDVARQFLSQEAQASWKPETSTITYQDRGPVTPEVATIGVELVGGELYDERGAWQGPLTPAEDVLELQLIREGDEYRIVDPPDAQIVPRDWFADRYRQANVYFFDRSSRILVPEPIFVPRGVQAATTLVRQLLAGPADDRVETTAFPEGMALDFSTPVSDAGVADIRLVGTTPPPDSPDAIERMLAQLAWTLRQEEITALRLTISDEEIRLPGGVSQFDVDSAPQFTPTGYQASYALHGLRNGLLVAGTREELVPVAGPFGVEDHHLRSVAVSIDGERAAGVSKDGRRVLVAAAREPSSGVATVVTGGTDLLNPAWDAAGRLWVVDRTRNGAVVSYLERGRTHVLDVPDVSGKQVRSFLVSRDGTRFVAVVRTRQPDLPDVTVDQLRVGRLALQDVNTQEIEVGETEQIGLGSEQPRIKDIAWTSTTTIAVLSTISTKLYSVQTVAIDGAPTDTTSTSISDDDVAGLAGTPVPDSRQYAVTANSLIDLPTLTQTFLGDTPVVSLGYVG